MKAFHCGNCGHRVFFDSHRCVSCGWSLGLYPDRLEMIAWPDHTPGPIVDGVPLLRCANGMTHDTCNWLTPIDGFGGRGGFCLSCQRSEVIPSLESPNNLRLWSRLELAKRQLLYNLLSLGLPLAWGETMLRFHFLEDRRRNPDVLEDFVTTGHAAGLVTINITEADDAMRHAAREQMQERYRTLLGHFRHEAGHYYFAWLNPDPDALEEFRACFGDERADYEAALRAYYDPSAPPRDWSGYFVSAYAAAHPHEDWAESFAHYLHIMDVLETACSFGLPGSADPKHDPQWLARWAELSVAVNELNRSLGMDDPYPFVLTPNIREKLELIHRRVERVANSGPDPAGAAGSRTHSSGFPASDA